MGSRFITTYRKDYNKKRINFKIREKMQSEFKDPINESFRHYLKLGIDAGATATPPIELGNDYLEKFNKLYPKLGKSFFTNSINSKVLERSFTMEAESVYQNDYCDKEKDLVYVEERKRKSDLQLPTDWEVPLTTQTASYRNPAFVEGSVEGDALPRTMPIKPKNHLGNNERVLKILGVKTGESEYTRLIGELGLSIVVDHLHGKIDHPECTCLEHHPLKNK